MGKTMIKVGKLTVNSGMVEILEGMIIKSWSKFPTRTNRENFEIAFGKILGNERAVLEKYWRNSWERNRKILKIIFKNV